MKPVSKQSKVSETRSSNPFQSPWCNVAEASWRAAASKAFGSFNLISSLVSPVPSS